MGHCPNQTSQSNCGGALAVLNGPPRGAERGCAGVAGVKGVIAISTFDGDRNFDAAQIELTRDGLLRVDGLLPAFFEPEPDAVPETP